MRGEREEIDEKQKEKRRWKKEKRDDSKEKEWRRWMRAKRDGGEREEKLETDMKKRQDLG